MSASACDISKRVLDKAQNYCARVRGTGTGSRQCATIVDEHHAVTYAHDRTWAEGEKVKLELLDGTTVQSTVVKIKPRLDVVFLETASDTTLCDVAPEHELPGQGFAYFHIGYSGTQFESSPVIVKDGIICGSHLTKAGHVWGSGGSAKGDSGGPVFLKGHGGLAGMVVGANTGSGSSQPEAVIVPISSLLSFE